MKRFCAKTPVWDAIRSFTADFADTVSQP